MSDESNPFAPPRSISSPERRSHASGRGNHRYAPATALAIWAMGMLALTMLVDLAVVGLDWRVQGLLEETRRGLRPDSQEARQIVELFRIVNIANVPILVLTIIAFLWWSYRMHRNLRALGVIRPELSSGWAIGGFFVPIMNLFRPCEIMCEVARGSDPRSYSATLRYWNKGHVTPLVGFWWALFLLKNVAARFGRFPGGSAAGTSFAVSAEMTAHLLSAAAALITILMIRRLTQNQELRYEICQQIREAELVGENPFQTPSNPWEAGFTG